MSASPAQIARNRLGGKLRQNPAADVTAARAELKAAGLEAHIRRDVKSWPPLPAAVRAELAILLLSPAGDDHAAT